MKSREQALLLLRKAAQDEALLDEVLTSVHVSDEIIGFHCQQAAEKILKALLSDVGVRFRKTHEIGSLMALLAHAGHALPDRFESLDALTHPSARSTGTRITKQRFPSTGLRHARQCVSCALGRRRSSGNAPANRYATYTRHTSGRLGRSEANQGFWGDTFLLVAAQRGARNVRVFGSVVFIVNGEKAADRGATELAIVTTCAPDGDVQVAERVHQAARRQGSPDHR